MAVRKGYNRYFIIFQEEDKGYGIAIDKQPTGYAKIEVKNGKCKITVYAQNLNREKGPYHFCMMDTVKTPAQFIKFGEIRVDDAGRGETWWEYNEDNIADSKASIDKLNVAVILIDGQNILAPLAGYTGKDKVEWKEKIVLEKKEHDHDHHHEHEREKEQVVEIEEITRKTPEEVTENNAAEEVIDEEALKFRKYEAELRNEEEEKEVEAPKVELKDEHRLEVEVKDEVEVVEEYDAGCINVDMTRHDKKHKDYKHHAGIFHSVLEQFEEIEELLEGTEDSNCRWWRIPYNCSVNMMDEKHYPFLCTIFHLNMTYPHIDYIKYYFDKGYYYFGLKYDEENEVKYLMYGIEGKNAIKDQPYMGMTGFGKWMPINNNDTGLWILFYNPRTGNFMTEKNE